LSNARINKARCKVAPKGARNEGIELGKGKFMLEKGDWASGLSVLRKEKGKLFKCNYREKKGEGGGLGGGRIFSDRGKSPTIYL